MHWDCGTARLRGTDQSGRSPRQALGGGDQGAGGCPLVCVWHVSRPLWDVVKVQVPAAAVVGRIRTPLAEQPCPPSQTLGVHT